MKAQTLWKCSGIVFLTFAVAHAQDRKRVAVLNFDYATVQSGVAAIFGSNQDVGKGIADLMVDRLVQDGTFAVIERKQLDKILAEQNFSNSDRADATTAAKIGRVLGVSAIIVGSVTQFGRDDKKTDIGAGAVGGISNRLGIGAVRKTKSTAVVQITARMIDANTAEILASVTSKKDATRDGTGIVGNGGSYAGAAGGVLDMHSSNFADTILGEATTKAVADLAQQLEARAGNLPVSTVSISGLVADAAPDGTLILNVGSKAGLRKGDVLTVKHPGREIRDPSTGKVLRRMDDTLGSVAITEVEEDSSVGKFSGAGKVSVGDTVTNAK